MDFEAMVSCVCERMKKKLGKHYWTDYLQFVQEEQLRCGGVEGVKKSPKKKKAKKSSKVKKGAEEPKEEAVKGKARRPDLKAISKKYLFSPGGSDLSNLKTCGHTTAFYPKEEARKKINLVDSKGLIVKSRVESLQHFKKPWAHEHEPIKHLVDAVKVIKPTVLIGTSGVGKTFTKEVVEAMAALNEKPIIFSLSNPTSQSECTAEEAYTWSKGRAIFASGSPFDPVEYNGKTFVPGQANNAYIFPGFGLGLIMSGTIRVHDDMLLAASEALAGQVTQENYDKGLIYPPFKNIRKISAQIAAKVAAKAYELGLATCLPQPKDLVKHAESIMYNPAYRSYR